VLERVAWAPALHRVLREGWVDDATAGSCRVPGQAANLVVEHARGQAQQGVGARAHCVAVAVRPTDDTGEAACARVARLSARRRSTRPER